MYYYGLHSASFCLPASVAAVHHDVITSAVYLVSDVISCEHSMCCCRELMPFKGHINSCMCSC